MNAVAKKPQKGKVAKPATPAPPVPVEEPKKATSELVRVPADIAEMLKAIEQHKLNGWNTITKILRDPDCPLADWLRPYYEQVIKEKAEHAARMKNG